MDREAAVIRSEIIETRAHLDRKLVRLEARARELTPRRYASRLAHERRVQQIAGAILLCGAALFAWKWRARRAHAY